MGGRLGRAVAVSIPQGRRIRRKATVGRWKLEAGRGGVTSHALAWRLLINECISIARRSTLIIGQRPLVRREQSLRVISWELCIDAIYLGVRKAGRDSPWRPWSKLPARATQIRSICSDSEAGSWLAREGAAPFDPVLVLRGDGDGPFQRLTTKEVFAQPCSWCNHECAPSRPTALQGAAYPERSEEMGVCGCHVSVGIHQA